MADGPFDMGEMMRRAQELQGQLQRVQEQLRHRTVDVTVGGGMVEVTANGQLEIVRVRIDPQAVDPRDVEMLQDLVVAAVNQALQRARDLAQEEMAKVTGVPLGSLFPGGGTGPGGTGPGGAGPGGGGA